MSGVLADTHALLWYLFEPTRLSPAADAALSNAVHAGANIYLSSISLIEVRYLVEKGKLEAIVWDEMTAALGDVAVPLVVVPVDRDVAQAVGQIPRSVVPELPDRIIAATAFLHALPLVTCDRRIQRAPIETIW